MVFNCFSASVCSARARQRGREERAHGRSRSRGTNTKLRLSTPQQARDCIDWVPSAFRFQFRCWRGFVVTMSHLWAQREEKGTETDGDGG